MRKPKNPRKVRIRGIEISVRTLNTLRWGKIVNKQRISSSKQRMVEGLMFPAGNGEFDFIK